MNRIIIGAIAIVLAITYHIVFNKEAFEDATMHTESNPLIDALMSTRLNTPENERHFFDERMKGVGSDSHATSSVKLFTLISALEELRAHYNYSKIDFDKFKLMYTEMTIRQSINDFSNPKDAEYALITLKNLKTIAKMPGTLPAEKMLKGKLAPTEKKTFANAALIAPSSISGSSIHNIGLSPVNMIAPVNIASVSEKQGKEFMKQVQPSIKKPF